MSLLLEMTEQLVYFIYAVSVEPFNLAQGKELCPDKPVSFMNNMKTGRSTGSLTVTSSL